MRYRYFLLIAALLPGALFALMEAGMTTQARALPVVALLERTDVVAYSPGWYLAAAAVPVAAFILIALLIPGSSRGASAFWSSLVATGILGICFLFLFHYGASNLAGWWWPHSKFEQLLFWLVQVISASYTLTEMPNANLGVHAAGFVFGVGLLEELVKVIPVLVLLSKGKTQSPGAIALAGLGSGIGFGFSEAILYASQSYDPAASPLIIYVVRFVTCVFGHGFFTAAVALSVYRRSPNWYGRDWFRPACSVLAAVFPVAVLHGLYDALALHGFELLAVAIDIVAFAWFAYQFEHAEASTQASFWHLEQVVARTTTKGPSTTPSASKPKTDRYGTPITAKQKKYLDPRRIQQERRSWK